MNNSGNELFASASSLKGTIVRNILDKKIGEIEEVVLDAAGQVIYVILQINTGFMGMKNSYYIVPWEAFHYDLFQDQEPTVVLEMDNDELERKYGYSNKNWLLIPKKFTQKLLRNQRASSLTLS